MGVPVVSTHFQLASHIATSRTLVLLGWNGYRVREQYFSFDPAFIPTEQILCFVYRKNYRKLPLARAGVLAAGRQRGGFDEGLMDFAFAKGLQKDVARGWLRFYTMSID